MTNLDHKDDVKDLGVMMIMNCHHIATGWSWSSWGLAQPERNHPKIKIKTEGC